MPSSYLILCHLLLLLPSIFPSFRVYAFIFMLNCAVSKFQIQKGCLSCLIIWEQEDASLLFRAKFKTSLKLSYFCPLFIAKTIAGLKNARHSWLFKSNHNFNNTFQISFLEFYPIWVRNFFLRIGENVIFSCFLLFYILPSCFSSAHPSSQLPGYHEFAFYHYILVWIFLDFYINGII